MSPTDIPLRQKLGLIAFGLFLTLLILEAALRLGGFAILSLQAHRNAVAMRRQGAYRILCVGESTTQGQYPAFLEQALNSRGIGMKFSVLDRGLRGTRTSVILTRMPADLDAYHPNMVVAMMGVNDHGPHMPYEPETDSRLVRFVRTLRIYRLARIAWLHIAGPDRRGAAPRTEQDFKKALRMNPGDDAAYAGMARLYQDQGRAAEAEAAYRKALELNPKNDGAHEDLGWFYQEQARFAEAETAYQEALAAGPKNDKAYAALGEVYQEQRKFPQAERTLKKALKVNPRNDTAYAELGWVYHEQRSFAQARKAFKKALEINPNNDWAYVELGWVYQAQRGYAQAEAAFKKALEMNPRNDGAYAALEAVYREQGKSAEEAEQYRKAEEARLNEYDSVVADNYRRLKELLDRRGVRLVCVQYPMRSLAPLRRMFQGRDERIIYVDNEKVFKDAVKKGSLKEYFVDMFGGDFGHCTPKGNELLARNIADVLIKQSSGKW